MRNEMARRGLSMALGIAAMLLGPFATAADQEKPQGWIGFRFCHYEAPGEDRPGWIEVSDIAPGSPAEEAGLESGDLIVALNEESLPWSEAAEVARFLRAQRPGTELRFTVRRGVESVEIRVLVTVPPH